MLPLTNNICLNLDHSKDENKHAGFFAEHDQAKLVASWKCKFNVYHIFNSLFPSQERLTFCRHFKFFNLIPYLCLSYQELFFKNITAARLKNTLTDLKKTSLLKKIYNISYFIRLMWSLYLLVKKVKSIVLCIFSFSSCVKNHLALAKKTTQHKLLALESRKKLIFKIYYNVFWVSSTYF